MKTLQNLEEGDIVENKKCDWEKKILFVLKPGLYVMSDIDSFEDAGSTYTAYELEQEGYEPVHPKPALHEMIVGGVLYREVL